MVEALGGNADANGRILKFYQVTENGVVDGAK